MTTTLVSIGLFLAIVLFVTVLSPLLLRRLAVRRRFVRQEVSHSASVNPQSLRNDGGRKGWASVLDQLEAHGLSLADTNESGIKRRLARAGYSHPSAPRAFTLIRLTLALLLPAIYIAVLSLFKPDASMLIFYAGGAVLAVVGLYGPNMNVSMRAAKREKEILNGFPDALDLMLVCVEAGLGLDAALNRVGAEMMHSHPRLSQQLLIVTLELRAGRSREDALRRLADRTGLEELRGFTTLLIQSEKLGSSIGQTLRVYAGEMREKRRMRAEEKANRLPVLLSIPLVTCLLPTMIASLALPAIIRIIRVFTKQMG